MKYMLLIYMEENAMTEAEREKCFVDSGQLCQDLAAKGSFRGAEPAASGGDGHERSGARGKAGRDRRSVRGNARTPRRLFPH